MKKKLNKLIFIVFCLFFSLSSSANEYFLKLVSGKDLVDEFIKRDFTDKGMCFSNQKCFKVDWDYIQLWSSENNTDTLVADTFDLQEQTGLTLMYDSSNQFFYQLGDNHILFGIHNGIGMNQFELKVGESFKESSFGSSYAPIGIIKECEYDETNDFVSKEFKEKFTNAFVIYQNKYNVFGRRFESALPYYSIYTFDGEEHLGDIETFIYPSHLERNKCTFREQIKVK